MKNILYIFLFFALAGNCFAQKDSEETFTVVEQMPEFPGGVKEMMKFIQNNVSYPLAMKDKLIGGKVFIKFVVNLVGQIENAEVIKGTGFKELDDEALRVVKLMPQWTPGTQNGKNVRVYFNVPIVFGLDEPYFIFNNTSQNTKHAFAKEKINDRKLSDAFEIYKEYTASNPSDIESLYNMGVISFTLKNKEDACKRFRNVAEKSTDEKSTIARNSKKYIDKYCN